ncbi:hypothetical protein HPB47_015415, partial [Ixodes persulcatus]
MAQASDTQQLRNARRPRKIKKQEQKPTRTKQRPPGQTSERPERKVTATPQGNPTGPTEDDGITPLGQTDLEAKETPSQINIVRAMKAGINLDKPGAPLVLYRSNEDPEERGLRGTQCQGLPALVLLLLLGKRSQRLLVALRPLKDNFNCPSGLRIRQCPFDAPSESRFEHGGTRETGRQSKEK